MRGQLTSQRGTALVLAAALLGALLALATPAAAHTRLTSSTPADGAVVEVAPDQIELVFGGSVSLSTVTVTGPDGAAVTDGDPVANGSTVVARLGATRPAGRYQVAYRVVASDGHPISGQISFTASAAAGPASSAEATPPSSAAAGASQPPESTPTTTTSPTSPAPAAAEGSDDGGSGSTTGTVVAIVAGVVTAIVALAIAVTANRWRAPNREKRSGS